MRDRAGLRSRGDRHGLPELVGPWVTTAPSPGQPCLGCPHPHPPVHTVRAAGPPALPLPCPCLSLSPPYLSPLLSASVSVSVSFSVSLSLPVHLCVSLCLPRSLCLCHCSVALCPSVCLHRVSPSPKLRSGARRPPSVAPDATWLLCPRSHPAWPPWAAPGPLPQTPNPHRARSALGAPHPAVLMSRPRAVWCGRLVLPVPQPPGRQPLVRAPPWLQA